MSLHQIWTMPATPIDHDALRRCNERRVASYYHAFRAGMRLLARARSALAAPVRALRGYHVRRSTAKTLNALDDRRLLDIGVPRHMIDTVAHRAGRAARAKGQAWLKRRDRARRVRHEMAELARIDPALYSDIGLRPHNFRDMAETIADRARGAETSQGVSAPPESRVNAPRVQDHGPAWRAAPSSRPAQPPRQAKSQGCAACA